jgi:uncharacterized coiled-coil protein SlyX
LVEDQLEHLRPMNTEKLEKRIEVLEELCAHQTSEIENLSDVVKEQWTEIDGLKKAMLRFRDRLTEVEETGPGGHENTRPPHY